VTEPARVKADLVPFRPEDAEKVMSWIDSGETLQYLCGDDTWPPAEDLLASWQKADAASYLLLADRRPVAYAEIWDRPLEQAAEIGHLLVDPARRGRGYGTLMLRLLVERAAHHPRVRRVVLNFHHGDETVLGCYLKAGFELVGSGPDGEGLRMERPAG